MAKRDDYEKIATDLIMPIIEANNYELVDVEYVKEGSSNYLRAYIDKPGGITVDDCEVVSRAFSEKLDEKDPISESYILEVSSPGLGRPFRKDKDFERHLDMEVEFKLFRPVDRKKDYVGYLKAFDKDTITIEFEDGSESIFERSNLAIIRETIYF